MPELTPHRIRSQIEREIQNGSYYRPEGHLREKDWFTGSDLRRASEYYGLKAAYSEQGDHWRLILSYRKTEDGYRALVYDPLIGVVEITLRPEQGMPHLDISPELEKLYWKERENGIEIHSPDGSVSGLSIMEFLERYFEENPTPPEVIDALRRRGRTQNDSYNCGPLAISAAYAIKDYLEDDGIDIGEPIDAEPGEDIVIEEPDDIVIGKPGSVYPEDDEMEIVELSDDDLEIKELGDGQIEIGSERKVRREYIDLGEPDPKEYLQRALSRLKNRKN